MLVSRLAALAVAGLVLNVLWKTGRVQVEPKSSVRIPVRGENKPPQAAFAKTRIETDAQDASSSTPLDDVIRPEASKIEVITGAEAVFASNKFQGILQKSKIMRLIPELQDPRVPLSAIEGRLRHMAESFLKQPISNQWDDTPEAEIETWHMDDWLKATQKERSALFVPHEYRRIPYWSADGRRVLPYPDEPSDKHALRFKATIAWAVRNAKLKGEYERTKAQERAAQEEQEIAQRARAIFRPRNYDAAKAASDE